VLDGIVNVILADQNVCTDAERLSSRQLFQRSVLSLVFSFLRLVTPLIINCVTFHEPTLLLHLLILLLGDFHPPVVQLPGK